LVATRGEPGVQADAAAAAALAAGVARGARELVAVNLTAVDGDPRVAEADQLAAAADAAAGDARRPD
jgi:propanediol dehydratase large subunit